MAREIRGVRTARNGRYDDAVAKKKPSPRAERREAARAAEKLGRAREVLARLEPGGAAERPVDVESASQIEPHASALGCLRCDGPLRIDEHAAVTLGERRLRVVKMRCAQCGTKRDAWFRIVTTMAN
jgi:hypothetical protein